MTSTDILATDTIYNGLTLLVVAMAVVIGVAVFDFFGGSKLVVRVGFGSAAGLGIGAGILIIVGAFVAAVS